MLQDKYICLCILISLGSRSFYPYLWLMIDWISEENIDVMMEGYDQKEVRWPDLWATLEKIAIAYNPENKYVLLQFLLNLANLMPCEECWDHFRDQVHDNWDKIDWWITRIELLDMVIKMHNNVNTRNWKKTLSFKEGLKNISDRIQSKVSEIGNLPQ